MRKQAETTGKARPFDPPWDWKCPKGHITTTPAGITPRRCAFAVCSRTQLEAVSPDGNPVRKPRT